MGHLNPQGTNAFPEDLMDSHVRFSQGALACMINSEIGAVLAVMRRNVRWGVHYVSDDDQLEHSLVHSLKELRKQIFSWHSQWHNINPALYLQPFLDVIQSDETGAPITGVALSSIYKILTLDILDFNTVNVGEVMYLIVDAVTSCRFEVTDPGSEEVVLMKILQVLLACMKSKASVKLSNQHVCNIINTCFRVVHQASSKGELLQRIARHTMHELVRCIFSHLPDVSSEGLANGSSSYCCEEVDPPNNDSTGVGKQLENGNVNVKYDSQQSRENDSGTLVDMLSSEKDDAYKIETANGFQADQNDEKLMAEPFGVPCMVEILHFLCSLLNVVEHIDIGSKSNPIAYDEDVPLFALGLINAAIELGGPSFNRHPKLLSLIQDQLFRHLMKFGMSMSPLILSMVCSTVLNLYQHLRTELKVQLEAFISYVLLRIAESKHGSFYQRQEVAMEALVDLCRQKTFISEMFANFDCDIAGCNVFEDLASLLSKNAFPVNEPLSAMHILALDGLIAIIKGIAERIGQESPPTEKPSTNNEEYKAFWTMTCENYHDPYTWVPFVRKMKYTKRRLAVGADHFNRDPKKGLEFLQGINLLPDKLDPYSVASVFRYTAGLDKNLIGDFLGNHDDFCVKVLHEFACTFDFHGMSLDTALRLFVGTFRLPGESQKIQRVLEAFAERYYEQSPHILSNKDAALLLSYSLILLNTDQHNVQVKKKMTEEDFIRNNRRINGGNDLPREYLSELYQSICENEIQMIPEQGTGFPAMTPSRWINVMHKSQNTTPYIVSDFIALLDYDMFAILSGPTIAAMSVVFDQAEHEDVLQTCTDGFLAIAKISAHYRSGDVLDDLVVSLCKFTNFLTPLSVDDAILAFGDDTKARKATSTVFTIANRYGDYIRSGWKNILDCVISFHKLGLLQAHLTTTSDATDDVEPSAELERAKLISYLKRSQTSSVATPRKSSGLMGRFSQFLSFDTEEPQLQPTEEQLAAQHCTRETIQSCHIDSIFMESKFLQAESLLQLVSALILAAGRLRKGVSAVEDENTAVFCLELLIAIALNNRDRIMLIWPGIFDHISNIVQSTVMPCNHVEKAVFGLLKICQRLLPYKENLTEELLKSLQLILKLDARVADAYCEPITHEVLRLVRANATHIRSHMGWRTIISLLSITARHPEASEVGFEALVFIMSDGAHLLPSNYVLCIDAARQFAESRLGEVDRSVIAIDMMATSINCLVRWSSETRNSIGEEAAMKVSQDLGEMWLRLVQALRKVCLDQREEVRNQAILMLQRSLAGVDGIQLPAVLWSQCFDTVIFTLLDNLLEIAEANSPKDYRKMECTLVLAMKLMSKSFSQVLQDLSKQPSFCELWLGVLNHMEKFMKVRFRGKRGEKIHESVPELLKNTLLVMKTTGILTPSNDIGVNSFWQLTWLHVKNICPSMQSEVFPDHELEHMHIKAEGIPVPDGSMLVPSSETAA
ncbi:ARF guanine-nucleotide exchange factor GNOM-like [Tripterygium wilfordii]|uniref:ARF guanine-nucleotide exchange factor GNOM-like n=1 Tax=Tripterygium wilfordii TaxID=458696 RepID=UPI0018F83BE2|nr:ARF guanine-nucleotide exchange factor GNOM-like [Tripterygium wilfordii]XP_038699299.1 ARF guanine-nucleotide exchange factor GNOM-like [Tripterygium wilfordii]XP_038699300.1 ARF guanine-nucleotide exchange factor GNOM-like [Tripterygium wilfordii]